MDANEVAAAPAGARTLLDAADLASLRLGDLTPADFAFQAPEPPRLMDAWTPPAPNAAAPGPAPSGGGVLGFLKRHLPSGPTDQEAVRFYQQHFGRTPPSIEAARALYARTGGPANRETTGKLLGALSFLVPAAGEAQAARLAARLAPKLAETAVGRGVASGAAAGLTFGALQGAGQVLQGRPVGEALKSAAEATATVAALGGVGGLVGRFIRSSFRKAAEAAGKAPELPKLPPPKLPEKSSAVDFVAGTRTVEETRAVPSPVSVDLTDWDLFVMRNRERVYRLAKLGERAARSMKANADVFAKRARQFLSEAMPDVDWGQATAQELRSAVHRLTRGATMADSIVAPMAEIVARQEGTTLEDLLRSIEFSPGQRLLEYGRRVRLARQKGIEPPPPPRQFVMGTREVRVTREEPFVRSVEHQGTAKLALRVVRVGDGVPPSVRPVAPPANPAEAATEALARRGEVPAVEAPRLEAPEPETVEQQYARVVRMSRSRSVAEGVQKAFLTNEAWLRRHGGGRAADMVAEVDRRAQISAGKAQDAVVRPMLKLTKAERENVRDVVRGEAQPMNARVAEVADKVRAYYDDRANRISEVGLKLRDAVTGALMAFRGAENHFPRRYDWGKVYTKLGVPKPEVLARMVESGQAGSIAEAAALLDIIRRSGAQRTPGFLNTVVHPLPKEFELDPVEELRRDIVSAEKRIAQAEVYGPRDERLHEAVAGMPLEAQQYAGAVVADVLGQNFMDPIDQSFVRTLLDWNTYRLGFSQIVNLTQNVSTVMFTNAASFVRGVASYFRDPEEARSFVTRAGVLLSPSEIARAIGESESGASRFLRVTGFTASENLNRALAALAGREWAKDLFAALQGRGPEWVRRLAGKGTDRVRRELQRAGVDVDAALARGSLSEDDLYRVANYVVNETQFPTADRTAVALWRSGPWARLITQFKRFQLRQTILLKKILWDDPVRWFKTGGRDGSVQPLLYFMTLYPAAGWLAGLARDKAAGRDTSSQQGFVERLLRGFSWAGGLGIASDALQQFGQDPYLGLSWLLGPTAELLVGASQLTAVPALKIGRGLISQAEGGTGPDYGAIGAAAARAALRQVPTAGGALSHGVVLGVPVPGLQAVLDPAEALRRAYIESRVTGNPAPLAEFVRRHNIPPQRVQALNRDPATQIRLVQELLRRAPPSEKPYWRERLRYWRQKQRQAG
ncbi:MAG: hypothetical protein QJR08_03790 [Bacillota bacterium]|nr:hypothetical protein [Bacillota bacterium]